MNVPHDLEAEASALGSVLLDRVTRDYALGAITTDSFYDTKHQRVWSAVAGLAAHGKPVDVTTVAAELERTAARVDRQTVLGLFGLGSSIAGRAHVDIVANLAARRQIIAAADRFTADACDPTVDPADVVARMERTAETVRLPAEPVAVPADLDDFLAVEDPDEDMLVPHLLARGERLIVTSGEGVGKSELQLQLAVTLACGVHPFYGYQIRRSRTLIVDLENSGRQLRPRLRKFRALAGDRYRGGLMVEERTAGLNLRDPRDFRWLDEKIEVARPDLVVIGPLYKLFRARGNESKADETAAEECAYAIDRLRARHGCAFSIEAHSPHGHQGDREGFRPIGASLWLRWPEFGLGLKPLMGDGPMTVDVKHWRGARDRSRRWPAQLMQGHSQTWPWVAVEGEA